MRIGILTTSYPRFDGDVAGSFVGGMASALQARGHEIKVVAPAPQEPSDPDVAWVRYLPKRWRSTFYGAGVPDNLHHPAAWLGLATFPPALVARAYRHLEDCDALVSHWALPCALAGNTIAKRRPHLSVFHSADVTLLERLVAARAWAKAATASGRCWFVSDALRCRVEKLSGPIEHVTVAPMGARVERYDRARARAELDCRGPVVLTMSRLIPLKGIDTLLAAAHGLNATLLIAGEGPEREALERLAARLDVRAQFLGRVSGADKWRAFAAADVLAVPSRPHRGRTEGAPVAIVEAMLLGIPVVASPSAGGLLRHGITGLVGDDFRSMLRALFDDARTRTELGQRAAKEAESYSWEHTAKRVEAMLRSPLADLSGYGRTRRVPAGGE